MLNIAKSYDFFKPEDCRDRLHIVGCGAIGSTLTEELCRYGITKFTLWDFDTVEPHNIANQKFTQRHVGMKKVEALKNIICDINPAAGIDIKLQDEGWNADTSRMSGYVFLCVDNIDLRREIATKNKANRTIKAMFDFRMGLTDAQHFAADWNNKNSKDNFINSMNFTHEEAKETTPVSACNLTLSVASTVRTICSVGVANFVNYIKTGNLREGIMSDPFSLNIFQV